MMRNRLIDAGYHEKRLLHHLLDNYNVLERPVVNESDPLQLSFGLTLMQIIDVNSTLMVAMSDLVISVRRLPRWCSETPKHRVLTDSWLARYVCQLSVGGRP
uniref:Neurotransmitter-gated ion-channel ligand-binding domain-containing protein n=1 Tax=Anopheles maculatus TaxID=74869 RepID=A0A182SVZ8_9DIPT